MKNNEKKGRLVVLLARGFLLFTATLLVLTICVFGISQAYYDHLSRIPDYDNLRENADLNAGRYEEVSVEKYLGKGGAFAVVNADGTTAYRSSEALQKGFTAGELECMQDYDAYSYVVCTPFTKPDGEKEYIFTKYLYEEDEEMVMILNENLEVVEGGFGDGRKTYTPGEVSFLRGDTVPGFEFLHCSLEDGRILVGMSRVKEYQDYYDMSAKANRLFLLLLPMYALVLGFFLLWINRQIKTPLVRLNRAIEGLAAGSDARTGDLKGPWEIRQIGKNFDRMADRLAESEAQRQKMDGERQKLLADISHDLKTPITVISGYTRAIRDGKVPEDKMDTYLQLIDTKAAELTDLVNSFHEFSKVEHPAFTLQTRRMDVCEFMRGYLADRYNEIELSGFSLRAFIPEEKAIYCMIDSAQMRRALDNILYNTLRHNSLGTVLVVSVSEVDRGSGDLPCARIVLADNGSGIPPAMRETLFEPFIKGDEARGGSGGSGLGLAITRRIIQAHGGSVRLLEPSAGGYSTEFEILLRKTE